MMAFLPKQPLLSLSQFSYFSFQYLHIRPSYNETIFHTYIALLLGLNVLPTSTNVSIRGAVYTLRYVLTSLFENTHLLILPRLCNLPPTHAHFRRFSKRKWLDGNAVLLSYC